MARKSPLSSSAPTPTAASCIGRYGPSAPGTELELPPGRLSAITWLDDGSLFVVLLQPNSETRALATCSAATGACTTQQSLDGRVVIAGDAVQELIPQ